MLGVTEAVAQGKLPTTAQLSAAVDKIEESGVFLESAKGMSVEGRAVRTKRRAAACKG